MYKVKIQINILRSLTYIYKYVIKLVFKKGTLIKLVIINVLVKIIMLGTKMNYKKVEGAHLTWALTKKRKSPRSRGVSLTRFGLLTRDRDRPTNN